MVGQEEVKGKENNIAVKDEIGKEIEESQKESLERELKMFKENLEQAFKEKDNYEKQYDLKLALQRVQLKPGNFRCVTPKMKFEDDDEYWEIMSKLQGYNNRMGNHMDESKMKSFGTSIKGIEEQIVSSEEKLKDLGE